MKKRLVTCILALSFSVVTGCAKKDSTLPSTKELTIETQENEEKPLIYLTQGAQTNDEEIPWNYTIDLKKNSIKVEWVEWIETETATGLVAEKTFRVHTTDVIEFMQSDSHIEFNYLDEENREIGKKFEILSEVIVKDENNKRYEWHELMRR